MHMSATTIRDIRAYGDFMSDGAARSLKLLQAIDSTVTAMGTIAEQARSFTGIVREMAAGVPQLALPIPEEEIIPAYEALQDDLVKLHSEFRTRCARAEQATELRPDDGVCDAYRAAMAAIGGLHDALETFRWLILEHNADLDPAKGQVMTDSAEIERYLAAL